MKQRIISLFLVLALVLSCAACSAKPADTALTESSASEESALAAENSVANEEESLAQEEAVQTVYPVTLTDQAGREVTIEEEPKTIVSGYYISTSLLIALGQKEKLVGIEAKAEKRAIYQLAAPELIELPNVGSAKEFDLEGCAALEPDLVILPKKLKDAADSLSELGIAVLLVNPENQELLNEATTLIAEALNCSEQADTLKSYVDEKQQELQSAVEAQDQPSVYFGGNSSILSTAVGAMYQSDLITAAGGTNVAAEVEDTYWVDVDYEQILAWNPEYILIASDAEYTAEDVLADASLAECIAVKNGNVYKMPGDVESLDSPIPGGFLGALWMGSVLHPEAVSTSTFEETLASFYQEFYGFTYESK